MHFGNCNQQIFHYRTESKNSIHDNKLVSKLPCAKDKQREVRPNVEDPLTIFTHFIFLTIFITTF